MSISTFTPVHQQFWDNAHFFWIAPSDDEVSLDLANSLDDNPKHIFSVLHGQTEVCLINNKKWLMNCNEKGNPAMKELATKIDQALGHGYIILPVINEECASATDANSLSKTYKFTFKTSLEPYEISQDEEKYTQFLESIQQRLTFSTLHTENPDLGHCSLTITPA